MQVLLFELAGTTFALKLEAVGRILAPGEALPEGYSTIDLADRLGLGRVPAGHVALLSGRIESLAIGRPVGTARIDPSWILPLPGYMFRVPETPVKGIIEIPPSDRGRSAGRANVPHSLLLDEEILLRMGK
jgi:hypothetical protein